ncbi:hypothetical protein K710_1999 [Streptococcus iniae SF1]|nr:hypothetical protein K710_1999 [Streptococcus iniae SF1]
MFPLIFIRTTTILTLYKQFFNLFEYLFTKEEKVLKIIFKITF